MGQINLSACPWQDFPAYFYLFTYRVGSRLAEEDYIKLERLYRDKHSNLFVIFVGKEENKFCEYGPRRQYNFLE
jgi:hypothetical protein